MIEVPFIGQAYELPSVNAAAQRCVNLYAEGVPGDKSRAILKRRSGQKLFTTVPGTNRRIYTTSKGRLFSVNGANLTEVSSSGTLINRGTLNTLSGDVTMADNGPELVIVDGTNGYVLNLDSNTFEVISDPAFPDLATHVTYQDGFIIVNNPASSPSGAFNISGFRDALSWNSLDIGNSESAPDIINSLVSTTRELWLIGPNSTEVWYNSGAASFPFQRINGTQSEIGNFAPFSLATIETSVFWLGANKQGFGQLFTNNGYKPQRISTHAIEQEWATYERLDDAFGFTMQEGGHNFYLITFPTQDVTWVYDATTNWWYEWAFTDFSAGGNVPADKAYKANSHALFKGKNYVADPFSGDIFELDPKTLDDNGNKIKKLRSSPHEWRGLDRVFYSSFQVDMEVGIAPVTGEFSEPQAMLRWSNDGAHTWSNQKFTPLGKTGEYRTRVKFNRLGYARDRVWEFSITDSVEVTILNAHILEPEDQ